MSKLDELISKLCPNGVEYKTIKEVVGVNRGRRLTKNQLNDLFEYEVYHGSKDTILGKFNEYNAPSNTTIVVNTGGIGGVKYIDKPFWCSDGSFWLGQNPSLIDNKYLYYSLSGYEDYFYSKKRVGGVPTIDKSVVEEFEIPVPPLPIQEEIVRILDNFTELTAELTAELQDRKKQYEYYRDNLLAFKTDFKKIYLGEIGKVCMCKRIMKEQTSSTGDVPFYKIGTFGKEPDAFISKELFNVYKNKYSYPKKGDILISCSGTIGRTVVFDGNDAYFQDSNIVWIDNDEKIATNRYLYYVYQLMPFKISTGGTIARLYNEGIEKAEICVPSLEVQERIVNVLDNFEKICNDLKIGLPAEIELRQKQYEYYRDMLLTFPENDLCLSKQASKHSYNYDQMRLLQYVYGYVNIELNEIGTLTRGKRFVHADAVEQDGIPCIHYGELYTYYGISATKAKSQIRKSILDEKTLRYANKGDVVIVGAGENNEDIGIGVAWLGDEPVAVHDACYSFVTDQNPKYISYFLRTHNYHEFIKKYVSEGKICAISADGIGKAIIQLPSLEEQKRIVTILDKFDKYCNDISEGLPAEIKYRQQQYEYYRDKLLSFKRIN